MPESGKLSEGSSEAPSEYIDDIHSFANRLVSNIIQVDGGDISVLSSLNTYNSCNSTHRDKGPVNCNLPVVASYNLRSLLPKINSLKCDILERNVDIAFLQEIWEQSENTSHNNEIESMFELEGLSYYSKPRSKTVKGFSYGGVAIIVNTKKFTAEKLDVHVPSNVEAYWLLVKPKTISSTVKEIVACSFYSPPSNNKKKNEALAEHIISNLHLMSTRYQNCAIILGADKNAMNLSPIIDCGLKLRQMVNTNTRGSKILDIIIMNMGRFYNDAVVNPPIQADDPKSGKPSDHAVPLCTPYVDRTNPPVRKFRKIKYRPLPESGMRSLGKWLTSETWDCISDSASPTEQAKEMELLLFDKLNNICPEKTMKIGCKDKPFITAELKILHRRKNREYCKRGKSAKYMSLKKKFDELYKVEAKEYMKKTVGELKQSNPSKMYSILKRLGARPGDIDDGSSFSLPAHVQQGFSADQSAESIADHFAAISQEYRPLQISNLPARVQNKLLLPGISPAVTELDVYRQITAANKPKSGVPSDMPRKVIQEFAPELSAPVCKIINSILSTGEWQHHWKLEHVIPIAKITQPLSEDDLRPISLTPFFSKVTEHFVVKWLFQYVGHKIDFRQYGGQ